MPQVNADYFSHSWDEAGHEEEAPVAPACRDAVPLEPVLSKSRGHAERHDKVTTVPQAWPQVLLARTCEQPATTAGAKT